MANLYGSKAEEMAAQEFAARKVLGEAKESEVNRAIGQAVNDTMWSSGIASQVSLRRENPAEEYQRRAKASFDDHQRHQKAASFLAAHPEFGEFIELIRTGSLSI
jgi:hypothetical protein